MSKKTIVLTGAAGFIGSNLAEALLKEGHAIIGIDNFSSVYSREKKQNNLEKIRKKAQTPEQFVFVEVDIRDGANLQKIFAGKNVAAVIHLAALAGVQPSILDPKAYTEVNVLGTLNLLETALKNKIHHFIFASSSSVYGGNQKLPFSETDPVDHPISPYAATKRAGELIARTYHHLHGQSIACLRFFTVYGPRQRPDLAIYKFTRAMLRGETITLYGDGTSSRDYTYIDDCVAGILMALDWVFAGNPDKPRFDIFNLGESQTVTLSELVKLLEKNLKLKAKTKFTDYLPGDVYATCADLTHSGEVLGYQPKVKIEEGIRKFCEWYLKEEKDKPWAS